MLSLSVVSSTEAKQIKALHTSWQITIGAFLGGPISGGMLLHQNWKRAGEPVRARRALAVGLVAQVFVLLIIGFGASVLPIYLIPLLVTGAYHLVTEAKQGVHIRTSRQTTNTKGLARGFFAPVAIGLLIAVGSYGIYPTLNLNHEEETVLTFGQASGELRYEKMTPEEAQTIGTLLLEARHFGDEFPTYAETTKRSGNYLIYIPAYRTNWENPELVAHMNTVFDRLSAAGMPFQLYLLDAGLHGRDEQRWTKR